MTPLITVALSLVLGLATLRAAPVNDSPLSVTPYRYQYDVLAPETGDRKGHVEERDPAAVVRGTFYLLGPDGWVRRVSYRVQGDSGFVLTNVEVMFRRGGSEVTAGPGLADAAVRGTAASPGGRGPQLSSTAVRQDSASPSRPVGPPASAADPGLPARVQQSDVLLGSRDSGGSSGARGSGLEVSGTVDSGSGSAFGLSAEDGSAEFPAAVGPGSAGSLNSRGADAGPRTVSSGLLVQGPGSAGADPGSAGVDPGSVSSGLTTVQGHGSAGADAGSVSSGLTPVQGSGSGDPGLGANVQTGEALSSTQLDSPSFQQRQTELLQSVPGASQTRPDEPTFTFTFSVARTEPNRFYVKEHITGHLIEFHTHGGRANVKLARTSRTTGQKPASPRSSSVHHVNKRV